MLIWFPDSANPRDVRKIQICLGFNQEKHPFLSLIVASFGDCRTQTEFYNLMAETSMEVFEESEVALETMPIHYVISTRAVETQNRQSCGKEEVDNQMFLHVMEIYRLGDNEVLIRTVETQVIVIALYTF